MGDFVFGVVSSAVATGLIALGALIIRNYIKVRKLRQQWLGVWNAYHFTQLPPGESNPLEARMGISHHVYDFKFNLFGPHGTLTDRIMDQQGVFTNRKRRSTCKLRRIRNCYMIECIDSDPTERDRIHHEFYPDFQRTVNDDRVYGCVVGETANNSHFTSPILMVITREGESDRVLPYAGNAADVETELAKFTWPIFLDLHPEGKSKKNQKIATAILKSLKTGKHSDMPLSATDPEVDHIVDKMISTQKDLSYRILELIEAAEVNVPVHVKQYWACHFNTTYNRATLQVLVERKEKVMNFLDTQSDSYVMVQLLRALHRDLDSIPHDDLMVKMIRAGGLPLIVRGWAYALLRERVPKLANEHFSSGELDLLCQDLMSRMETQDKRVNYMACTLAGHLPELIQLEPFLEKCQEDSSLFVREAALAAALRAREIRDSSQSNGSAQWMGA